MNDPAAWLPSLLRLEEYGGDWQRYIDAVYAIFERDFIQNPPTLQGLPVGYRHLVVLARRDTYMLLVTAFPMEQERRRQRFRAEYEAWAAERKS